MEVKNTEILTMEIIFASQNPYHIQTTVFSYHIHSIREMAIRHLDEWSAVVRLES
jgi:hypothetical protein